MIGPGRLALSLLLVGGSVTVASAARFGVPEADGTDPPGWFALVADDAVDEAVSPALGDVAGFLTVYIEVARQGLRVDLFDPGTYNPTLGSDQLDFSFDPPGGATSLTRYTLFGPTDALLADQTFGPDTPATDRQLVTLFDAPAAPPGLYKLVARLLDGVEDEQDVNVFGISIPGHDAWVLNFTGGHLIQAGATVRQPILLHPRLDTPSAGSDADGPTCGLQFVSYDLDAAANGVEPPVLTVTSRGGYAFPPGEFPPSGDARWWVTDNAGIPGGPLDSNDHGIWTWGFSDLDLVLEDAFGNLATPVAMNVFSVQVLNYAAPPRDFVTWPDVPSGPPFIVFNPDRPRRIYLPSDDGGPPLKEHLGHRAEVIGGFPVLALEQVSLVEVTIELDNPTGYPLQGVEGRSHVAPNPDVSDPVLVGATGGLVATIDPLDPRRIDFAGDVAAGTTATVTYEVEVTPSALGSAFLTGDGAAFVSAAAPTVARYQTPFTLPGMPPLPEEVLGPVCDIQYEAVMPECVARAQLRAERTEACPGTPIELTGIDSEVMACPGGVAMFQWRANGAVVHPFPAADTIEVTPFFDDTWTLEVACSTDPACVDDDSRTFQLYPGLDVDLGLDLVTCAGGSVTLTADVSGGTGAHSGLLWTTDPPGEDGDGATALSIDVTPSQTTTYTFRAEDELGCEGRAGVTVTVPTPAVAIEPPEPAACPGGSVELRATAGMASYAWTTTPPGLPGDGATTESILATELGAAYRVVATDDDGCPAAAEVTVAETEDTVPGPLGPSLRLRKFPPDDLHLSWRDVTEPSGEHQVVSLDCDGDLDGVCDTEPTPANLSLAPSRIDGVPTGVEEHVEPGGLARPSWLVFYKVRAASPCTLTPGPFLGP